MTRHRHRYRSIGARLAHIERVLAFILRIVLFLLRARQPDDSKAVSATVVVDPPTEQP